MNQPGFTIVVNSCDKFEDCWVPFFTLLSKFWVGPVPPVVLVTEQKEFSFPGLAVHPSRVSSQSTKPKAWADCLKQTLEGIESDRVLYLQDDYFLDAPVQVEHIKSLALLMTNRPSVKHIGLTHFGSHGPYLPDWDPNLRRISQTARYRVCTQAGLWDKATLSSYLEAGESGWEFELKGSIRARQRPDLFLTVSPDLIRDKAARILSYMHTGIIQGQWNPAVPALFRQHDISVDFSKRAYYRKPNLALRVVRKLSSLGRSQAGI